jgi:hypothetical protein
MNEHFDARETRDPEAREREQLACLRLQIEHAKKHAPAFARILGGVEPEAITTRQALARIPVTRKSALVELQKMDHPFGGLAATRWGDVRRVFASPGPIYEPKVLYRITGASRARFTPPDFGAVISSTTAFRTTSRRQARCSKRARMRSAAPYFRPGSGKRNSRFKPSPI